MTRFKDDAGSHAPGGWLRDEGRNLAELSGLVGFAVVQPVLGPFGESPETFTAVGAEPGDIVRFALLVSLLPVLVLWGLAAVSRAFGDRVRSIAQTVLVAGLAAMAATAFTRSAGAGPALRFVLAAQAAGLVALLHRRQPAARMFLRYTAPVPALLVAMFLFASSVAPLVRPSAPTIEPLAPSAPVDRPPVLFVVFDELPTLSIVDGAGAVDAVLFPNLARLADTSTWYRNHTSLAPATGKSIPSLLTGSLPADPFDIRAATFDQFPDNLITLLAETHQIHGKEWATSMCGPWCRDGIEELDDEAQRLLNRELAPDSDPVSLLTGQARSLWWSQVFPPAADFDAGYLLGGISDADDLSRPSLEFLSGLRAGDGDRPVFDYLHSALPHQPWWLLPSGQTYDAPEVAFGSEFLRSWPADESGAEAAEAGRVRHLLQLQWADRILGATMDRLDRLDRWDDALVIVTADHGISFEAGTSTREAYVDNQVPLAWTPLFVKLPGQRAGEVDDTSVTALDVTPTVLDVVGVEAPWEIDGRSLLEPAGPTQPKPFILQQSDQRFPTTLQPGIVALDADGLSAVTSRRRAPSMPGDQLAVWRHGRHGSLLGQRADALGICQEPGLAADWNVPTAWEGLVDGTATASDALPLWHEGTVDATAAVDLAIVVDGVVAGWGRTLPSDGRQRFGILVADSLARAATGDPELLQIVDGPCRLRPTVG